ncbi:MAG TPA: DNA topoisomerase IB [Actinomycetota bacterium]|jgi:DNA topoisomerase IB|nr:DNA topoisomerase IB [Actinomycetota bacterium]
MPRLRRVDTNEPGIRRRGRGRGFEYLDANGRRISDPEVLERIRSLAIPPAWRDVWICPLPHGHLQAVGTDAAGRKQYLYHERWRRRRDQEKFDRVLAFARHLPQLRLRVEEDLRRRGMPKPRVLACAARLLDLGFFRIGSESYAEENQTYGLATLRKDHVLVNGDVASFDYAAKGGARRIQVVRDPLVVAVVRTLRRRRTGGDELLAYLEKRRWVDVRSGDINDYLKEWTRDEHSAKDFRTWNGTLLAAVALALDDPPPASKTARGRRVTAAVKSVAEYLGNTPAVCRASYIDPRVVDRFLAGQTIRHALQGRDDIDPQDPTTLQGAIEEATIDLLRDASAEEAAA